MLSFLRKSKLAAKLILIVFASSPIGVTPAPAQAQERYPAVTRLSFVSGPVTYSRGDDPDEWDDAIENVPLTIGDRIYAPEDGRAELQLSSGNFVRLAPRSYLSTLNLSDDIKQFHLGEGAASFNIRRLQSDEVIEIDTPNVSVTLEEPGRYRVAVDEDGNSRVTVRRGRATVAASGRQIAVENSEIRVYGIDSPRYEIIGLPATDAFDRWVSDRDDRFDRSYSEAYRHASEDIIGAEDLAEYGRWEEIPEYGYAWTPSRVAASWAPFSDGRWYWQDPWGWSWISNERWGWATSHYGRWTSHRSRWYWVPVRPRTRVRYAPACVEFVRVRDHVGWFPLHPRDRHVPWWERRDRQYFDRNVTYVNRTHVTVVNHNTFITARPVNKYIVRDSVIIRDARSARFNESLPIPSRSSLRIVSENGGRRGQRPSDKIVNRVAVVRTAVPASPRAFQDKLPEIQKNQGRAVEPARTLAAKQDDRTTSRVRVRPAAETGRGEFAPRNPGATAGPVPQPLTEARGKKLATREESAANNVERPDRDQKTPAQSAPPQPSKATANRPESPRVEQDRERQREEKQTPERERQAQQQQEIERQKQAQDEERKARSQQQQQDKNRQAQEQKQRELERRQSQQKEDERKAPAQNQPAQERRQEPQERQSAQQRLEELERRQAQQREAERKAQQNRQEQERREQLKEQQLQERQTQRQRQQELERREQEQERKTQAQHQQQEQARREQLKQQQQAQERQARDQQRQQQEVERRQQQQQREQDRNAHAQQRQEQERARQLRQQQAQEQRQAQQVQRQQEQERRPQPKPQPQQERQPQQIPRQPGSL